MSLITAAVALALHPAVITAEGCTSAIVAASASADGRAMLWKHRDSGFADNFVERVNATDSTYSYVALFNAGDTELREAWIGFNEKGFAVMNTASYNLAPDTATVKDREGIVMSRALACCRTVADFDSLLSALPRPLGVQANFGVIDAEGNGAFFETCDGGFSVFPLSDSPTGVIVRTNYSFSGGTDNRKGEARYDAAVSLLSGREGEGLSPDFFTEEMSTFIPPSACGENGAIMIPDEGNFIPRRSSSASCVVCGPLAGEDPAESTVMWTAVGFPAVAPVERVTLGEVPQRLRPVTADGHSPACDQAVALRGEVFPRRDGKGHWLFDMDAYRRHVARKRSLSKVAYESYRNKKEQK